MGVFSYGIGRGVGGCPCKGLELGVPAALGKPLWMG